MKKNIAQNYLYNLLYQLLVIIIPLIVAPYLTRILGAEMLGVYSYTLSISAYFVLVGTLGTAMYGKREIAYIQDDREKVSQYFWEIMVIKICTMGVSSVLFYNIFVKSNHEYGVYYTILLMELIANIFDISWLFQGLELFKKIIFRNLIIKVISVLTVFTIVKTQDDLYKYFLIYTSSMMLANLSLWVNIRKHVCLVKINKINVIKHIIPSFSMFIPQVAVQLYTVLDRTMIGYIIADKSEVGFYDQSQRLVATILTIVTSLGTVMLPRISNTFAKGDIEAVKRYIYKSFEFVFFLSIPMSFGIISVSKYFIPIYLGEDFIYVATLINILAIIIVFIGMSNVVGVQFLLSTKRQKMFTISVFAGAIMNFIFNLILIRRYGALGASVATVIAEFTVIIVQLYVVRKELNIKKIICISKNYLLAGSVMYICVTNLITSGLLRFGDLAKIVICVIIGIVIYFIVLIILKDDLIIMVRDKIIKNNS